MAPATLITLPNEIVSKILSLCSKADRARARLVSSRFPDVAAQLLFRKLTFWHTPQSAEDVAAVIASKNLRGYVREFCFSARNSDYTADELAFRDSADALPAQVSETLRRVSLIDNPTAIRCSHAPTPYDMWKEGNAGQKFDKYRGEVHKTLILSLAKRNATPKKLETLDIFNLPCRSQPDLTDHAVFAKVLERLQTLLLRFDYDPDYYQPYNDSPLSGISHDFFARLPRAWLAPAASHLKCLALSAPELWGYLLKVDFRGVHFPKLETLVMNNFVFSHDWQLDWILSHNSLQEMRLMQCRILTHAIWFGEKDDEGYPTRFSRSDTLHLRYHQYAKAWHHYYQRFLSLDNLTYFTTKADDRSVVADLTGMYEGFDEGSWLEEIPEPDRQAEDKRMLKDLRSKAHDRLKAKLKAKSKAKSRSGH